MMLVWLFCYVVMMFFFAVISVRSTPLDCVEMTINVGAVAGMDRFHPSVLMKSTLSP